MAVTQNLHDSLSRWIQANHSKNVNLLKVLQLLRLLGSPILYAFGARPLAPFAEEKKVRTGDLAQQRRYRAGPQAYTTPSPPPSCANFPISSISGSFDHFNSSAKDEVSLLSRSDEKGGIALFCVLPEPMRLLREKKRFAQVISLSNGGIQQILKRIVAHRCCNFCHFSNLLHFGELRPFELMDTRGNSTPKDQISELPQFKEEFGIALLMLLALICIVGGTSFVLWSVR